MVNPKRSGCRLLPPLDGPTEPFGLAPAGGTDAPPPLGELKNIAIMTNRPTTPAPAPAPAELLETALEAARRAAEIIVAARRRGDFGVSMKTGEHNLVTTADVAAEEAICTIIRRRFPDHRFLAEEGAQTVSPADLSGPLWVIDPIDGTTNFIHGHRQVAVSIAFALGGTVEVGVVHAPFLDDTYAAVRTRGATLNGRALRASANTELKRALIATGFPYTREALPEFMCQLNAVLTHCRDIRRLGAAALDICMVAAGNLDGYYETVNPWDMAAACLIAREAGALTGHIHPRPSSGPLPPDLDAHELVVGAPGVFEALRAILARS